MDTWNGLPVIDDTTPMDEAAPAGFMRGAVPRDFNVDPPDMFADPSGITLIDPSEYDARIDEQEAQKSSVEHLYLKAGWENLDQNGDGYCWSYSVGHCVMIDRVKQGAPYVRLNPHSVAAIIKRGRDEGGWCGLSAKFYRDVGVAPQDMWPLHSRSLSNDTPAVRAEMAKYRVTDEWVDLAKPVYDQNLTLRQIETCLLRNIPVATDYMWWAHSVCAVRLVRIEAGSYGTLILNSWKGWGRNGLGVLRGNRRLADGAVAVRSSMGG